MFTKLALTFGTSVAILLFNIAGGVLKARLLGPMGRGLLTAVSLWPTVIASIGNLGLVNAVVYYSGKESDEKIKTIWSGSFLVGILQSIVFGILGYFFIPILMQKYSAEFVWMARLFLLYIPLYIFLQYNISILQGRLRIGPYNLVRILVPGSYFIGIVVLALLDSVTVQSCTIVLLLSNAITVLCEVLYLNKLGWLSRKLNLPLIRQMMSYGLKAHIGNISSLLSLRLDQILMSLMLSADKLGLYVVAVTISSGVNLISDAIATIAFPTISSQALITDKRTAFARSLRLSFWSSWLVVLIMLLLTNFIVNILFGTEFSGAISAARVLILAASVSGMNMTIASGLKGYGKPSVSSIGEVISLCLTGVFLWIFMPRWGILGAALASLIAYSCNCIYLLVYIRHNLAIYLKDIFFLQPEDFANFRWLLKNLRGGISVP